MEGDAVDATTLELSKENILPLRRGRDPAKLARALASRPHTVVETQRQEFLRLIQEASTSTDPLGPWIGYIRWIEQTFPSGSNNKLVETLEECVRTFKDKEEYKNDRRFVGMWRRYADLCQDPTEVFRYMSVNGIGQDVDALYISWADALEQKNLFREADNVYIMGKNRVPSDDLKARHREFQIRLVTNVQNGAIPQPPNPDSELRPALGGLRAEEAALNTRTSRLERRSAIPSQRVASASTAAAAGRSNDNFQVFVDEEHRPTNSAPTHSSLLSAAPNPALPEGTSATELDCVFAWSNLSSQAQIRKENAGEPSTWIGFKIPQNASALPTQQPRVHGTGSVHIDDPFRENHVSVQSREGHTSHPASKVTTTRPTKKTSARSRFINPQHPKERVAYDPDVIARETGDDLSFEEARLESMCAKMAAATLQNDVAGKDDEKMDCTSPPLASADPLPLDLLNFSATIPAGHDKPVATISQSPIHVFSEKDTSCREELFKDFKERLCFPEQLNPRREEGPLSPGLPDPVAMPVPPSPTINTKAAYAAILPMFYSPLPGERRSVEVVNDEQDPGSDQENDIPPTSRPSSTRSLHDSTTASSVLQPIEGPFPEEAHSAGSYDVDPLPEEVMGPRPTKKVTNGDVVRSELGLDWLDGSAAPISSGEEPPKVQEGGFTVFQDPELSNSRGEEDPSTETHRLEPILEMSREDDYESRHSALVPSTAGKPHPMDMSASFSSFSPITQAAPIQQRLSLFTPSGQATASPTPLSPLPRESPMHRTVSSPPAQLATGNVACPTNIVRPFDDVTRADLISGLSPPLASWSGFIDYKDEVSSWKDNEQREIILKGKHYSVLEESNLGQVYEVLDTDEGIFALLKVQSPPRPWEFYIARTLQERLPEQWRGSFVTISEAHAFKDRSFLFLDLSDRFTLRDVLGLYHKKRMDETLVMFYTIEMLKILEEIHNCGIIHANIGPGSFLIRDEKCENWEGWAPGWNNGWNSKGLKLINFECGQDMTLFPQGTVFKGSGGDTPCIEMQTDHPWTTQGDLFGMCVVIYKLLYGEKQEMEVQFTPWTAGKPPRWRPKTSFQGHTQAADLWLHLFDTLLNIPSCQHSPPLEPLRRMFENHLVANPTKVKEIKRLLCKQSIMMSTDMTHSQFTGGGLVG